VPRFVHEAKRALTNPANLFVVLQRNTSTNWEVWTPRFETLSAWSLDCITGSAWSVQWTLFHAHSPVDTDLKTVSRWILYVRVLRILNVLAALFDLLFVSYAHNNGTCGFLNSDTEAIRKFLLVKVCQSLQSFVPTELGLTS
jgi:hypothetical protein